ncbi:MAG TPA: hypothetical protein VHZ73_08400 [Vicinamibacterales bacterium]|nr:hypothetical protein [Vicinamibacterales bacterium]
MAIDMEPRLTPDTFKVFKAFPEEWTPEDLVRRALSRETGIQVRSLTRRIATLESLNLIEVRWPRGLGLAREVRRRDFQEHA